MFTVTGQVIRTFIQAGEINKQTGEIPVNGEESRLDLITLTVENPKTYEALQGKKIRVPFGFFAQKNGDIIYFVPKGAMPEVIINS
jgi:hypothetical protein